MATIGIHLKHLSTQQANAIRKEFGAIAAKHRLTDSHGRPSPGDLIISIADGTTKTVRLSDVEMRAAIDALGKLENDAQDYMTLAALQSLIRQLS